VECGGGSLLAACHIYYIGGLIGLGPARRAVSPYAIRVYNSKKLGIIFKKS